MTCRLGVPFNRLPFLLRPLHRQLTGVESPAMRELVILEELRFDAVGPVVA